LWQQLHATDSGRALRLGFDGPAPPINSLCQRDILAFLESSPLNLSIFNLLLPLLYGIALIAFILDMAFSRLPGAFLGPEMLVRLPGVEVDGGCRENLWVSHDAKYTPYGKKCTKRSFVSLSSLFR
jgi:hypothetical protein